MGSGNGSVTKETKREQSNSVARCIASIQYTITMERESF